MNKFVFLDRDGIINKKLDNNYVKTWSEFEFLPDAIKGIKFLNSHGFQTAIVSNQAGVSRGIFTYAELMAVDERMHKILKENGAVVLKSYYCPHKDEDLCACKKPKSGMFFKARDEFGIDLNKAWIIGDGERDIVAGKRAGCRGIFVKETTPLHLKVRHPSVEGNKKTENRNSKADFIAKDLLEAAEIVVRETVKR